MINEKLKELMEQSGVPQAQIQEIQEKYDFDKIYEIINSSENPKEALEKVNAFYPDLEVAKMQEQMDFIQSQIEAAAHGEKTEIPIELTEDELDSVVGGSWLGDWLQGTARVVVTAVIMTGLCAATGAVAGGTFGGPVGAVIGAVVLGAVGGVGSAVTGHNFWDPKQTKEYDNYFPDV